MAKAKIDKDINDIFNSINELDPYAKYLEESNVQEWLDTGSLLLNALVSGSMYKGLPMGRLIQFAGPSQTYKTGFMMQIAASAQKAGKEILLFDTENAWTGESAKSFGLDVTRIKKSDNTCIESVKNIIHKFLSVVREKGKSGQFIIIIDSLANMQSVMDLKRMDKESESSDMGTRAKAIKALLTECTNSGSATNTPIIFTNHVYDNPTEMYPSLEKNMPGGRSVIFLPSVIVQLARKLIKDGEVKADSTLAASQKNYSGVAIKALTVKNRFIKQYLEGEMYLSFSTGMDKYYGLLEIMKGMGVVIGSGATYTDWEGNKLGYEKSFRKNKDLWENKLLPELESRIGLHWKFGNLKDGEEFESDDIEDDSKEEIVDEKPLDKLKKLKQKVTETLDEYEEEVPDEE